MKLIRLKENLNWALGAVFLFIVLGVGSYWLYRNDFEINFWEKTTFEVQGANFDFGSRKIPKDAKKIEFIFSKSLNPETVNEDSLQVQPDIDGYIGVSENKLIYHLEESLEKGSFYDVYIKDSIQSRDGTSLGKTLNYSLEVGGDAKTVKFSPEGSVENLNQTLLVFFNMPMVDISSLNQRDKLDCPLKTSPSIDGDCQWINSSVLEYQTDRLYGATDYDISIDDSSLNYTLTGQTEYEINTPDLKVYLPSRTGVSPADGVSIRTNFPVSLDELYDKLDIYYNTKDGDLLNYTLKTDKDSPTTYNIYLTGNLETPQKNKFSYDEYYYFEIKEGLNPKHGNRSMSHSESKRFRTKSLINQTLAYRKIYSGGNQVDTRKFSKPVSSNHDWILPVKDFYIQIKFDQEIPNENELSRYFQIDGMDLNVNYGKRKQSENILQDKQTIIVEPKLESNELNLDSDYVLKIDSDISDYLYEDEIIEFKIASENTLDGLEYVDHTKTCLYFSNEVDLKPEDVYISPEAEIVNVSRNEHVPRDIKRDAKSKPTYEQQNQYLKGQGYCPKASYSQDKWVLQTRLDPHKAYSIGAKKGLEDIYGYVLNQNQYQDIETGEIDKENQMIFSFSYNDESVLPSYKTLILNIQSKHVEDMDLEVCEMDWNGYQHYLNNARSWNPKNYTPNCVNKTTKTIDMQNKGWVMADNIIDIQKDVLGRDFETNFVLTRARLDGFEHGREYGKSFTDLYIRSNAFISLQKAENRSLLFVTDYEGNRLQEPFDLNFYREVNNLYEPVDVDLQTTQTGYVYETQDSFDIVKIQSDEHFGILNTRMDSLSNRDYDYFGGETTNQADYLYIHTDRPIYKPGDTVQFKGYYREFGLEGYQPMKIDSHLEDGILSVLDSDGNTVKGIKINLDENSNFTGSFQIPDSGSLGFHMFEFDPVGREKSGNWNRSIAGDSSFRVEEYEPESMEVNIQTSKDKYMLGQKAKININPKYYFGGKVKSTKGEIRVLTQNYFFDADDYRDYQFGEGRSYFDCLYWGACDNSDNFKESIDFQIDESGEYTLDYEFDDKGEKLYTFEVQIQDPDTQKWISNSKSVALHSTDGYVGLDHTYYNSQEQVDINGVVLDTQGNPKADSQVQLELIKKDYNNAKYQGVDGVFYNDYSVQKTTEQTNLVETNRNGKFEKIFEPEDTGQYKLKATYTGTNNSSFTSTVSLYVAGDDYVIWGTDNNNIIELKAKDIRLKNGQTQEFVVQSPVDNGKALVTVLQDDVLLDYFVHDIETFGDRIQIPIKDNYYPNFYTKVFIIGQNKEENMPVFARGVENTQVNTDYKKLNVDVQTDKERYKPGENVILNLDIKDNKGNPIDGVDGSIAVVDKSVLALLGNPKINPFSYFYDVTRSLAVDGYSSLKNLIEVLDVSDYEDGSKGGGGALDVDNQDRQRGEFRDTAFWIDQFETDENGKVEVQTDRLPDNLTTRNIQVLANHPETNQIGVGTNTFQTSQEVMIDTNLPRFVSSGDEVVFKPVVHNQSGQDGEFEVYMTGGYMNVQNPNKTLYIQDGQSVGVEFMVNIDDMGILKTDESIASKINIQARSKATGGTDNVVKYLQVYESSSPEQIASIGQTDQRSYDERINTKDIQNNKTVLDINYSPTLISNILDVQRNLTSHDGSSILSQLNALMPYVYNKKMHDLAGREYSLDEQTIKVWKGSQQGYENVPVSERIHNVLASLPSYNTKYSGLARWPSQTNIDSFYPSLDVNAEIVYSLGQLKNLGYYFDTSQIIAGDLINFLEDRFYKNKRPNCNADIYNCEYTYTQRLKVVLSLIAYYGGSESNNDSELFDKSYKMWKQLEQPSSVSNKLLYADVMARLLKVGEGVYSEGSETPSLLSPDEKNILQNRIDSIMDNILNNELVYNPRGAYIGTDSLNDRLTSTAKFINILAINGMDKYEDISNITDNLFRWLMESKENSSFGSYRDDILVLETINNYLADSNEILDTDMKVDVLFNDKNISSHEFDKDNIFETVSLKKSLDGLNPESIFNISKIGSGTVYYDISMKYYLPANEVKPRNRGFGVSVDYYDYDEYENIKIAQNKENQKYRNGDISYEQLEYPGSVFKYIQPVDSGDIQVGDILVSRYTIINNEKRDDVMMNSYIPAGMELLNPNLETQKGPYRLKENSLWDVNEFRQNKLFGYKQMLDVGRHTDYYIMRVTHKGKYFTKPTSVYEQDNQEVFGRNKGKMVEIGE